MAEEDRCLCGLVHVKTGTWIIAIIQIVFVVINIGNSIQFLNNDHKDDGARYAQFVNFAVTAIWFLCIILLMVALCKDKASLMVPHLSWTVFAFILLVVNSILMIVNGAGLHNGLILLSMVLLMLFLLIIEWRCYKYIRAVGYP